MDSHLKFIEIDSTPSTNTLLTSMAADVEHGTVVLAREQNAGRGQRGNTWEAEPGKNITMSMLLKPVHIHPKYMHLISEIISLSIIKVLRRYIEPSCGMVSIKWPNDIYVDNKKICGILVENAIMSDRIAHSGVGIGLNVNQREFRSDAPNPVSMCLLTGKVLSVDELARELCAEIMLNMSECLADEAIINQTHALYQKNLWRKRAITCMQPPTVAVSKLAFWLLRRPECSLSRRKTACVATSHLRKWRQCSVELNCKNSIKKVFGIVSCHKK